MGRAASSTSWLHDISESLFSIAFERSLMMSLGSFELLLIYIGSLLRFLYCWYVLSFRFKRISRKSADAKLILMVMFKPQSLNIFIIYFLFHSFSGPEIFFIIPRPSSRYNPINSHKLFTAPMFQRAKIMKQSFIMAWQKHHLRRDMVTTRGLSYMSNTKMTLNCQNISGILQILIKF